MKRLLPLIFILLICACSKEEVMIGRDAPEVEIKKCHELLDDKDYEKAIQCLEMFKSRYAQTSLAQEAELKIGDTYYDKKEYLLAAESYIAFVKLYPNHTKSDYAYYRIGASYLKESPKAIDRDQEYLDDAIKYLAFVVRNYPRSTYYDLAAKDLDEALTRLARRNFYIGRFYYRTGEYIACLPRFADVVTDFPGSGLVDRSLYMITMANLKLGRIEDAKFAYSKLATDFPGSKWTKKAEKKMKSATK
jgi:outer membrane protein assembly factor BamD